MKRFDVYATLARVRPRPAMYIGSHSLTRLRAFLDGCFYMAHEYAIECCEQPDFGGLHDWVAKRFGWYESTAGWCNIIVQECGGDEGKALDRFFELVEEYRQSAEPGAAPDRRGM
jgi:hypothetical protein